ncbi:hypothetical protein KIN20_003459 [Parelaphostrongylus tenuis]|uniref:Uncharacterized protein n=1 Tax=Parelaphostrongylus tenuis TaxID=148309 RepID=A0AAD5QDR0_PARTN|nr:hypothetical protein KIN20_003459 [Parelaphostrongylus tenuis]
MYVTDTYGIRLSIMCGTVLNFFGSLIRVASSVPSIDDSTLRLVLLHSGSVIAASAQAFFLVLPSKIAEAWFPENQRSLANSLTFIANPLGAVLGTVSPPLFFSGNVQFGRASWHMFNFSASMGVLTTLTFLLSLFIRHGSPPTPPSASSANHSSDAPPFWMSIKMCFSYPVSLAALIGVVASLICAMLADHTKKFKEIVRICWVCFVSVAIFTRFWLRHKWSATKDSVVLMLSCAGLGAFSIPQFPIGVEMGVETTFPIYEATSSGLLVLSGQLWMFVMYFVFETTKKLKLIYKFNEGSAAGNWQMNLDIWCALAIIAAILSFAVNPRYKRLMFEDSMAKQNISPDSTQLHEVSPHAKQPQHKTTVDKTATERSR